MATGYIVSGRGDLDALFKARTSTAGANTGFKSNGDVDLAQRFEPRGSTTAIAATGFKVGATDLAQTFMDIAASVGETITIGNASPQSITFGSTATAQYQLTSAGDIRMTTSNNTLNDVGDWLTPKANFGNYSVRATVVSGSFTSGTFGSWLVLSSARTWALSGGVGGVDAVMDIEIRLDSSGIVQDTARITFHAEDGA